MTSSDPSTSSTQTTASFDMQTRPARRWHPRLRRDLIWAVALKLLLLLVIKAAFFPQRLPADVAAQGVVDRMASSTAFAPASSPVHPALSKDPP